MYTPDRDGFHASRRDRRKACFVPDLNNVGIVQIGKYYRFKLLRIAKLPDTFASENPVTYRGTAI